MKDYNLNKLNDFQRYFEDLYGNINNERDWQEIYGYLSRTTGYLTKTLVKKRATEQDFVRPISWLFALASKLDISLEDAYIKKFPGICPYCIEPLCCCHTTNKQPKRQMVPFRILEKRNEQHTVYARASERTFNSFARNTVAIYPGNQVIWQFAGPWMNCAKLFEEVAELQEAIAKHKIEEKTIDNVTEEFADVFAWILSAWTSSYPDLDLADVIKNYFYEDCPVCKSLPCACQRDDARLQSLIDAKVYAELRGEFEELTSLAKAEGIDLSDLIESLKSIETNQNETVANATITHAKSVYDTLDTSLTKTESVAKKLTSIGKAIGSLSSVLS